MTVSTDARPARDTDHPIRDLLVRRWSPRAMSGATVSQTDLERLFEAARWAPSSYNIQPWRFIYAHRGSSEWQAFFDCLVDANQSWADQAGVLVVICSLTINPKSGETAPTHAYDTGAAWQNFALQGTAMDLVVHGMAGFDAGRIAALIKLPKDYSVAAMAAVGHPGKTEDLPEKLQGSETPSDRLPIEKLAFAGRFPSN